MSVCDVQGIKNAQKAFSSENSLTPSKVPPQLQGLAQTASFTYHESVHKVYTKCLVYFQVALDRQKKATNRSKNQLKSLKFIITCCVRQCYSLHLPFSLTNTFLFHFQQLLQA